MPAGAVLGGSAISAGANIFGSSSAANAQADAAKASAMVQAAMYRQSKAMLEPYRNAGESALGSLNQQLAFLTSPIELTQEALEKTPGYQFTKAQGLKAVQNSAAARGLGVSGAALKGAANFATGLADQTYQTQFNLENTNRTNTYNRLANLANLGENAAAMTGQQAIATGQGIGNAQIGAGNAQAAAYNSMGSSVANAAGNVGSYYAYKGMYGTPSSSSTTGWY